MTERNENIAKDIWHEITEKASSPFWIALAISTSFFNWQLFVTAFFQSNYFDVSFVVTHFEHRGISHFLNPVAIAFSYAVLAPSWKSFINVLADFFHMVISRLTNVIARNKVVPEYVLDQRNETILTNEKHLETKNIQIEQLKQSITQRDSDIRDLDLTLSESRELDKSVHNGITDFISHTSTLLNEGPDMSADAYNILKDSIEKLLETTEQFRHNN